MPRYFIEVSYKGTNYSGFQKQQNANSIQAEVERSLSIFFKQQFNLTCASRTDAGVHALQNFFHFDREQLLKYIADNLYNLNALLPIDIVIKNIYLVNDSAHCRFDAINREYKYIIYQSKNPFLSDRAYYYPYKIDFEILQQTAQVIIQYKDFTSFSKRNTQVKNFICSIKESYWLIENDQLIYNIISNRFLRGMVRGIVGTMLRTAKQKNSITDFKNIIESKDCSNADFSVPPQGLFLKSIHYEPKIFI